MANTFRGVSVSAVNNDGTQTPRFNFPTNVNVDYDPQGLSVKVIRADPVLAQEVLEFPVHNQSECSRVVGQSYIFTIDNETLFFKFASEVDCQNFHLLVSKIKAGRSSSVFTVRTEDSSAMQYFQFYGYLSQQQNMMQDYVRTSTYQRAILSNINDFKNKVVLDVGAGSGILSFFAAQAGARKVYAVEASNMAHHAQALVRANGLHDRITVVAGKIEEIELPETVDVIISEPMGYMLYNERMLETYLHAKKWLKPNGNMYPTRGDLHIAPFTDDALFMEQYNKANFWYQNCFHGVDLSALRTAAMKEYFRQPIVDTFDVRICMSRSVRHVVDFLNAHETDLHRIEVPFRFELTQSGTCHGLAFWFDVLFAGSTQHIWLSTAPTEPLTHWYQVRCLLETPIFAKQGQALTGRVLLLANKRQSYDVTMEVNLEGTNISSSNTLDLKNPYFRYTGAPAAPPPGVNTTSPSESYWNSLETTGSLSNGQGVILTDGTQQYCSTPDQTIGYTAHPNMIKTVMLQEEFIKRIGISQNGDI
ncbi:arginine methyltransferase 4 [Aphomia sociella]